MSSDTIYTIKITIDSDRASEIEEFLNQVQAKFTDASIDIEWTDEFGKEVNQSYGADLKISKYYVLDAKRYYEVDANGEISDWCDFISNEAAEILSNHQGNVYLGVTSLSDSAALSLSKIRGEIIFPELNEISEDGLRFLSNHEGGIALSSIENLTDELIDAFAKRSGYLNIGLTHLRNHAALLLSKHRGDLHLDSLTEISDEAAEQLSKHQGDLSFGSLEKISTQSAESFSRHIGDIYLPYVEINDEIGQIFAKKQGFIKK
jgi:hypothetical protein